jgi:hypothetical protein
MELEDSLPCLQRPNILPILDEINPAHTLLLQYKF